MTNCAKSEKIKNPAFIVMRRELKSYFTSPIAYIVTGLFLILNGIIFYSTFFLLDRADLRQLFGNLPLLLLFLLFFPMSILLVYPKIKLVYKILHLQLLLLNKRQHRQLLLYHIFEINSFFTFS